MQVVVSNNVLVAPSLTGSHEAPWELIGSLNLVILWFPNLKEYRIVKEYYLKIAKEPEGYKAPKRNAGKKGCYVK